MGMQMGYGTIPITGDHKGQFDLGSTFWLNQYLLFDESSMSTSSIGPAPRKLGVGVDQVSQQKKLNAATSSSTRELRRRRSSGKLIFTSVSIVMAVLMSIFVWSLVLQKASEYAPGAGMAKPQPATQAASTTADLGSPRVVSRTTK